MKKLLFFISTVAMTTAFCHAQSVPAKTDYRFQNRNSVQLELGGHGLIYSLNYERNLLNFNHFKTSVQIGFAFYPKPIDLRSRLWVPISFNQLFSYKQHHLELGIGMVITEYQNYSFGDGMRYEKDLQPLLAGKIGYRYQKPAGRMQYKLLFTPILDKEKNFANARVEFIPLGAFSIGYTF
jgi:hypothetical protein